VVDKTCVVIDDIIDTGGSIVGGCMALKQRGARRILTACTHAVLSGPAIGRLHRCEAIEQVIICDTICHPEGALTEKFACLSVAPLLAEAINRIHHGASVSELFLPYI
jgi:ribose-phosphate pyrophosphokinase